MTCVADDAVRIVGGGLAGSLLAVYLARRGLGVDVFEKRPDMRGAPIPAGRSINLALANRGIRALRKVGLYDEVSRLLTPMRGRMLHDERGECTFQPYGQRPDEVIYSVSRGRLNRLLMSSAEGHARVRYRFNAALTDIDTDTGASAIDCDGKTLQLPPGRTIACDGAGSPVRRALCERPGFFASEDLLPHGYKELTIPPGPCGEHRIEREALHIWPRGDFMLIALPNLNGSFTVTLFLAAEGDPSFASLTDRASVEAFFGRHFPDTLDLIPDIGRAFFLNPTGIMGTVRCEPWYAGDRVLLLGDAAHAIVPFHGQGMNCAFEDCEALDRCLDEFPGNWGRVMAEFQRLRKPNADAIATMALENYVEMRDSVRDPRFHLKKELAWALEKKHPDRFIPRYSMVMFRHVPYATALERGALQQEILETILGGADDLGDIDMAAADALVDTRLPPLPETPE